MNYTFDTTTNIKSRFISEDYFPAIVQFSPEELNNHFIEYSYNDTDMFELVVDSENGSMINIELKYGTRKERVITVVLKA